MTWAEVIALLVLLPPLSALVAAAIVRDRACFRIGIAVGYQIVAGSALITLVLAGILELI